MIFHLHSFPKIYFNAKNKTKNSAIVSNKMKQSKLQLIFFINLQTEQKSNHYKNEKTYLTKCIK